MKKGRLILSGGGDIEASFDVDKNYFSLLKNNSKILYIPVALDRTSIGFEACYDWFSTLIAKHSKNKELDFTMLLENDQIPDLMSYNSIYIGGGNTYKLLDYIIKNNLDKKLIDYLKKGGVVYGGSAGAIIFGKDIRTVDEENDMNYPQFLGLNFLRGYSVICHYSKSLDRKIFESVKNIKTKIIALPENSGILLDVKGNVIETIGKVFTFDGNNKIKI